MLDHSLVPLSNFLRKKIEVPAAILSQSFLFAFMCEISFVPKMNTYIGIVHIASELPQAAISNLSLGSFYGKGIIKQVVK